MFCPKCGTGNPDDGKFCRSCGVDIGGVSAALSGDVSGALASCGTKEKRSNDPNELFADSIRNIVFGFGFMFISAALLFTNVANGSKWWWAMLFPAFSFLAKGIADNVKASGMKKARAEAAMAYQQSPQLNQVSYNAGLPPSRTEYVPSVESRYKTGDLVPPSVTDTTTRHLEMNPEGETMTLPKK